MPLPTFDSDKDINATLPDAYGVTDPRPVTSPWLDLIFALYMIIVKCFCI